MKQETQHQQAQEGEALSFDRKQRDWLLLVAYLHLEQDKPEKAGALLRLLARVYPDDGEVLQCLALSELMANHPQQSARAAIKALKVASADLKLPVGLVFAKALWQQGKQEAAREFLSSLLTEKNREEAK